MDSSLEDFVEGDSSEESESKKTTTKGFSEGSEVRKIIKRCHDILYKDEGLDPARAYDELTTLLIVKVFSEKEDTNSQFTAESSPDETTNKIRMLLQGALEDGICSELLLVNGNNGEDPESVFQLDDETIHKLVSILQDYSFSGTYTGDSSPDIKGEMFQEMVGETFRAELGAYFTPREVVDFMVDFLEVKPDSRTLDPSCGSGGFFVGALNHLSERLSAQKDGDINSHVENFVEENIWGVDINHRMVRTSRFNLFTYSNSTGNIHLQDGLQATGPDFDDGSFDRIFSNPPFAGQEDRESVLNEFEIGRKESGETRSVSKELPFIEKIVRLLDEGGKAGIVLPESVFNNQSQQFKDIRKYLYRNVRIEALIGLPREAFHHTDTGVQGALLFVEKTEPPEDYEVYIDWAENVGYNTLGHKIGRNDLPDIVERYKDSTPSKEHYFELSELRENGRIDPFYYHPERTRLQRKAKSSSDQLIPLSDIVEEKGETISNRVKTQKGNHFAYIEVRNCSKEGEITGWRDVTAGVDSVPSRLTYWMKPGTILLSNHRDSIKSGRNPILVPEAFNGEIDSEGNLYLFGDEVPHAQVTVWDSESETWKNPSEVDDTGEFPLEVQYDIEANSVVIPDSELEIRLEGSFVGFVTTNRLMQLHPRDSFGSIDSPVTQYADQLLQTEFVREQLIRETTGAASPELKSKNLEDITVPVPEDGDVAGFMEEILQMEEKIDHHKQEIKNLNSEIRGKFDNLIPES
ncbi:N-6 DNA methylase [Halomicrococcus gelatinilyticus]|uniref:N-6 DNA methylase n=1 Tax=Halomicrococcus gelatinilyticus TaxID=1702103 RepID=UPI002E0DC000